VTGTKFLLLVLAALLVVGCGSGSEEANVDPKKPDQAQVDQVKAEGGIPN
jgi:hypothetical protein